MHRDQAYVRHPHRSGRTEHGGRGTGGEDSGELRGAWGMTAGVASRHWTKGTLQDLVFFQRGFDITKAQQTEGPIPVISSSGITSYHNEARAAGPGVVIGRKGTLGSVHYSEMDYWPHDTTLWSRDLRGNNPRFVYFYLH